MAATGGPRNPPGARLPGLFPVHDGSYGVNTLVSVEPSVRRSRRSRGSGIADEDDEDQVFRRRVRGKDGRRHGTKKNDDATVQSAVDEANKVNTDSGTTHKADIHPLYQSNNPNLQEQAPNMRKFSWAGFPQTEQDPPRNPPYTQLQLQNQNRPAYLNNRNPSEAAIPRPAPPYGIPLGRGSSITNSTPSRPDSSRSFNAESGLFTAAALRTPQADPDAQKSEAVLTRDEQLSFRYTGRMPPQKPVDTEESQESSHFATLPQFANLPPPRFLDPNVEHGQDGADTSSGRRGPHRTTRSTVKSTEPDPPQDERESSMSTSPTTTPEVLLPKDKITASKDMGANKEAPPNQKAPANKKTADTTKTGNKNKIPDKDKTSAKGTASGKDKASTKDKTSEYNTSTATSIATGLTPEQLRLVSEFVRDMRLPETRSTSQVPLLPFDKLTLPEITATKKFISNMKVQSPRVTELFNKLEKAKDALTGKAATKSTSVRSPRKPVNPTSGPTPGSWGPTSGGPTLGGPTSGGPTSRVPTSGGPTSGGPIPASASQRWYAILRAIASRIKLYIPGWSSFFFGLFLLSIAWLCFVFLSEVDLKEQLSYSNLKGTISQMFPQRTSDPWTDPWADLPESIPVAEKKLEPKPETVTEKAFEGVKKKLPESIHVEKDVNGKRVIPQDFWHALKELIKADDVILSLKNAQGQPPEVSEHHWQAIKSRLENDGSLSIGADETITTRDVEQMIDKSLSRSWGNWLEQNEVDLRRKPSGATISRDEFVKLVHEESKPYQSQIQQELDGMDLRVKSAVEEIRKLEKTPAVLDGVTRDEIDRLVKATVKKVLDNARLDAIANGQIKGHATDILANQINHFGVGAGAIVDPDHTSPIWKPPKSRFGTKAFKDRDGYKPQPAVTALLDWSEEGECFCAGPPRTGKDTGVRTLAVLTSRNIIPQHLVVDHILAGATLDPGAMPKEIEVWAKIEEVKLRAAVELFSQEHFPTAKGRLKEGVAEGLPEGFVKIGHFVYENKDYGNGEQVFKLSDQLGTMGAITEHIMVRALNNYGAADHTCFYRVRVFGEIVEREVDPDHPFETATA